AGKSFCAGADIREFDLPPQPPHLTDVIQRFADAAKPVVAALHGNALGGGCELAAGCHYRVAARGTKIGLPEVNLGLLPGAGGTQRMPRLVGFDAALALMLDGKPRAIDAAEAAGFVAAIDRPFADAVARARADFLALRDSPECKALRHAFFAEREVGKPTSGVAIGQPRAVGHVAVIGAGTMGQGIAIALLHAGLNVTLVEAADAALARAQERIAAHFNDRVSKGRMTMDQLELVLRRLTAASAIDAAAGADVVIEAVFEDIGVT